MTMPRRQRRFLILCSPLLFLAAVSLCLALLLLSWQPVVPHPGPLAEDDFRHVEQLIVDNSPARFQQQGERQLSLDDEQLNLLTAFALSNVPPLQQFAVLFDIEDDQAVAQLSIPQSFGPITIYLNLNARFAQDQGRARLIELRAGRLPVPRNILRTAERLAGYRLETASIASQELAAVRHSVLTYQLGEDKLHLTLAWQPSVLAQLRSQAQQVFVSEQDQQRILAYHQLIAEIASDAREVRRQVPLQSFIPPLFELAYQRSLLPDADAIAENRALLQTLSFFVNDLPVTQLIGEQTGDDTTNAGLPTAPSMVVMLHQRNDLALHFVSASAIAASAGVTLAEVLSNSKEVYDARYGTGFSFSDLTANAAGVALGEFATSSLENARHIQQLLMKTELETGYMPVPRTDTDGLDEAAFIEKFGARDSPAFLQRLQEINDAVMALQLYNTEPKTDSLTTE
jgi:hypothetical protein